MDDGDLLHGGMTPDQQEKILQYQDLTGIEDVSICRDTLQRHNWDLEVAIQDQLNIREGRPSMFAVSARAPNVIVDPIGQQYFPPPTGDDLNGGIFGLFRYVFNLVFKVCYSTVTAITSFLFGHNRRMVTDPLADVMGFISSYELKFGSNHPVFYQGTYTQALNDAKQELRFLLVFLHQENNTESEKFCRLTLSDESVISLINANMFMWACSANSGEGYRVSQIYRQSSYPFLAMVVMNEGSLSCVARMEGNVDGQELVQRLRLVMRDYEACLVAARAERLERSFNQNLRAQQDEAYQQSLRADQEKERERREARRRVEEMEEECRRQEQEARDRKDRIERLKIELLDSIPNEPSTADPDSVHLVIKLPSGTRLERRFLKTHSLQALHNFVFCHPSAPDSFEITTNFPKRRLDCKSDETFEECGIKRGEVLFVNDLDA